MVTFYYATLSDDTESDVDDEPTQPLGKHIFYREDPKEEQASVQKKAADYMAQQQSLGKPSTSTPSKAGPIEKKATEPEFLSPTPPGSMERPVGMAERKDGRSEPTTMPTKAPKPTTMTEAAPTPRRSPAATLPPDEIVDVP